jgi:oligopeptide transport system substrate-binding protein
MDMFVTKGGNNQTGWSNAEYDKLIKDAKANPDVKARMQQLHDAETILMKDMPVMPIYHYNNKYVQKAYFKNVIHSPLGFVDFKTATIEK